MPQGDRGPAAAEIYDPVQRNGQSRVAVYRNSNSVTHDLVVAEARALKFPGIARVFESLARQARTREFKPVPLGLEAICAVPPSA